jgi:hypothetical protein
MLGIGRISKRRQIQEKALQGARWRPFSGVGQQWTVPASVFGGSTLPAMMPGSFTWRHELSSRRSR